MEAGNRRLPNSLSDECSHLDINHQSNCSRNESEWRNQLIAGVVRIPEPNLWCLTLVLFPAACIFGNFLVVVAVLSERSLKTSTNFLLVSLACADLLVGTLVMPFSVYLTINRLNWFLPDPVCNFFCVADVSASTASIVHLVAISIDRFYAVVRHMEYKSPKHKRRIYCTILFSWMFSIGIGLPLGIGMNQNDSQDSKIPYQCGIVNPDYMLYMSIFAFYIPCLVMIVMYGFVFYRLHRRMKAVKLQEMAAGQMVQFGDNLGNIFQSAYGNPDKLRRASMMWAMPFLKTIEATIAENDDMSTEELEELTTILHTLESEPRRQLDEIPENSETEARRSRGLLNNTGRRVSVLVSEARKRLRVIRARVRTKAPNDDDPSRYLANRGAGRRASFYRAKQTIKTLKDRAIELLMKLKSKQGMAIRKETRATKLVATVMLVFLLCYMPFFTLNIAKVFMLRLKTWNYDLEGLFIFFTWLGYFNSCLNPLIYSLFNRKFRAAFQKLLHCPAERRPTSSKQKRFSRAIGDSDERKSWIASQRYTTSPARYAFQRSQLHLSPIGNGVTPNDGCKSAIQCEERPLPVLSVQRPSTTENMDIEINRQLVLSKSASIASIRTKFSSSLNSRSSSRSTRSQQFGGKEDEEALTQSDQDADDEPSMRRQKLRSVIDPELAMLRRAQFRGYYPLHDQIYDFNEPVEV